MKLLLKEVHDLYIQENFKRIQQALDKLGTGSGDTTNVNNTTIVQSVNLWTEKETAVSTAGTDIIDSVALADFKSVDYIFTVYNEIQGVVRSFNMKVVNENGVISDTLFAKLGSSLGVVVNAAANAGNMEVTFTNNEIYDLGITLSKREQ